MIIREAVHEDIPHIVAVLKASLGEKDLPLSEEIWNYKHVNNPFGKSLVFIAEENGTIIGVRAFMKWEWRHRGKCFKCFRAVDTATHPAHQGKGIFKKLTLEAVQLSINSGANFVFNTPNDKSRPGYLKMGWIKTGQLEVAIKPVLKFWNYKKQSPAYKINYKTSRDRIGELCTVHNEELQASTGLYTSKSVNYLKWRYEENPLIKYEVYASSDIYLACYVKERKGIKELRISECLYTSKEGSRALEKIVGSLATKLGVHVISYSGKLLDLSFPFIKGSFGPILTIRELNLEPTDFNIISKADNWCYSLGDLELF